MDLSIDNEISENNVPSTDSKEDAQYIICSEIKRAGKQKSFCEDKFLNSEEVYFFFFRNKHQENFVVSCFTNFCEVCCEPFDAKECLSLCHKTHLDKKISNIKDPEEIFINVCSSETMGNSMSPFCDKFYGHSLTALKLCQHSFCYDCCVSEFKINGMCELKMNPYYL